MKPCENNLGLKSFCGSCSLFILIYYSFFYFIYLYPFVCVCYIYIYSLYIFKFFCFMYIFLIILRNHLSGGPLVRRAPCKAAVAEGSPSLNIFITIDSNFFKLHEYIYKSHTNIQYQTSLSKVV